MSLLSNKRAEISAAVAMDLGLGPVGSLTAEQHGQLETETDEIIEQWSEAEHDDEAATAQPVTPLQRLLAEYRELEEQELDRREQDAGLT